MLNAAVQEAARRKRIAEKPHYTTPDGIVAFAREKLRFTPTPYQERILRALVTDHRVAVRGPHGLGKTALAAIVTLWAMENLGDDVKVVTTAGAWRQLSHFLWPEIRKWAARAELSERPRILDMALKYNGAKEAFAVASDDPALIEGAHASKIVYILDESKSIMPAFWDAIEGALSTGDAYVLAISTPGLPSGRFYDIHSHKPGYQDWTAIHVTLQEAIAAGRIKRDWADLRKIQWGEKSAVYQTRVLGEFADSGEDNVIPLSWVELANERFEKCGGQGSGALSYGLDPARYGTDSTTTAKLVGRVLETLTYHNQQSTMETAGRMAALARDKQTSIGVDVIGIGAGVYDRLNELGYRNAQAINASESAKDSSGRPITDASGTLEFYNRRSQLWWALREALDPEGSDPLALPPDDRLTGDLTAPSYTFTSNGRIRVESKDDIRARIGRSTDAADALALALEAAQERRGTLRFGPAPKALEELFGGICSPDDSFDRQRWFADRGLKPNGQKLEGPYGNNEKANAYHAWFYGSDIEK